MYERFCEILFNATRELVPEKTFIRPGRVPWNTKPPAELKNRRHRAWASYKAARSSHGRNSAIAVALLQSFLDINFEYRNFSTASQSEYEKFLVDSIKAKPKLFHSYIKHKKTGNPTVGPIELRNGRISSDPSEMCEELAEAFASVYTNFIPLAPAPYQTCSSKLYSLDLNPSVILKQLKNLKPDSAPGPDGIHPCLLRECAAELTLPLSQIFYKSLHNMIFPRT